MGYRKGRRRENEKETARQGEGFDANNRELGGSCARGRLIENSSFFRLSSRALARSPLPSPAPAPRSPSRPRRGPWAHTFASDLSYPRQVRRARIDKRYRRRSSSLHQVRRTDASRTNIYRSIPKSRR